MSLHLYTLALIAIQIRVVTGGGAGNVTVDANGFAPSWVKDPDGRGTWTIVYSSGLTMFLAAWMSLHLNIPPRRETRRKAAWRWIRKGLLSFLIPELIIFTALSEWLEMRKLRKDLNAEYHRSLDSSTSVKHGPKSFSRLYAWYAVMGGFGYVEPDTEPASEKTEHLVTFRPDSIQELAKCGVFLHATDESISDKSKADYFAKSLVCVQVLWFVCQAIQRKIAGLPISLLEFHTLINIACGLLIYALWWGKPRGVETATIVETSTVRELVSRMFIEINNRRAEQQLFHHGFTTPTPTDDEDVLTGKRAVLWLCSEGDFRSSHPELGAKILRVFHIAGAGKKAIVCIWDDTRHEHYNTTEAALDSEALATAFSTTLQGTPFELRLDQTPPELDQTLTGTSPALSKELVPGDPISLIAPGERNKQPQAIRVQSSTGPFPSSSESASQRQPEPASQQAFTPDWKPSGNQSLGQTPFADNERPSERPLTPLSPQPPAAELQPRIFSIRRISFKHSAYTLLFFTVVELYDGLGTIYIAIVLSVYAALHLIPTFTDFSFPSHTERVLWKAACYLMVGCFGAMICILLFTGVDTFFKNLVDKRKPRTSRLLRFTRGLFSFVVLFLFLVTYLLAFVAARMYLMVEAFISLRRERAEIFQTPDWNWLDYIPHI